MNVTEKDPRFSYRRTVEVEWPDGDGPELIEREHKGRAVRVTLSYDWNRETWWSSAKVMWRWLKKDGTLGGMDREAWSLSYRYENVPWLAELVREHRPRTTVRLVEEADPETSSAQ